MRKEEVMKWQIRWHESNEDLKKMQMKAAKQRESGLKRQLLEQMLTKCQELGGVFPTISQVYNDKDLNLDLICQKLGKGRYEKVRCKVATEWKLRNKTDLLDGKGNVIITPLSQQPKFNLQKPQKQEVTKVSKSTKPKLKYYTYEMIWSWVKEYNLVNLTNPEIISTLTSNNGPNLRTIQRHMGSKRFWAKQVDCETAEEAQRALAEIRASQSSKKTRNRVTKDYAPQANSASGPILTLDEINTILKPGGTIDSLNQTCAQFTADWDAIIHVGEIPVKIALSAVKLPKIRVRHKEPH